MAAIELAKPAERGRGLHSTPELRVNAHGFSLYAAVRWRADQRLELEQLCRYITRPAGANERLKRNRAGQVVLQLKSPYKDGTTHVVMEPAAPGKLSRANRENESRRYEDFQSSYRTETMCTYRSLLVSIQAFNGGFSRSILPIRTHRDI